jgi:hypothetical protein
MPLVAPEGTFEYLFLGCHDGDPRAWYSGSWDKGLGVLEIEGERLS